MALDPQSTIPATTRTIPTVRRYWEIPALKPVQQPAPTHRTERPRPEHSGAPYGADWDSYYDPREMGW